MNNQVTKNVDWFVVGCSACVVACTAAALGFAIAAGRIGIQLMVNNGWTV